MLGLASGWHVLEVGRGKGGAVRYLATTYGCRMTGVDPTEVYRVVATPLSKRIGLASVSYASALAMLFADASFDAAYALHLAMNIEDKAGLYREVTRGLKAGARFADIVKGAGQEVIYPMLPRLAFWPCCLFSTQPDSRSLPRST